jgi:hypothetical protein
LFLFLLLAHSGFCGTFFSLETFICRKRDSETDCGAGSVAQVVKWLLCKCEVMSCRESYREERERERERGREREGERERERGRQGERKRERGSKCW